MEWYKVYIYDKQGLCLATERHETEDDATESVYVPLEMSVRPTLSLQCSTSQGTSCRNL